MALLTVDPEAFDRPCTSVLKASHVIVSAPFAALLPNSFARTDRNSLWGPFMSL